jgi:hypothetical protein
VGTREAKTKSHTVNNIVDVMYMFAPSHLQRMGHSERLGARA